MLRPSLYRRILLPILLTMGAFVLLGAVVFWKIAEVKSQDLVRARLQTLGQTIALAAEDLSGTRQMQRMIKSLGLQRDVAMIFLVSGHPPQILMASKDEIAQRVLATADDMGVQDLLREEFGPQWERYTWLRTPMRYEGRRADVVVVMRTPDLVDFIARSLWPSFLGFLAGLLLLSLLGIFLLRRYVLQPIQGVGHLCAIDATESSGDEVERICQGLMNSWKSLQVAQARLQENETYLDSVLQTQQEMICRFDTNLRLTFANAAFLRLFSLEGSIVLGHSLADFLSADEKILIDNTLASLGPHNPQVALTWHSKLPPGEESWREWTAQALFNEAGSIREFQATGRDVSALVQAHRRLQHTERQHLRTLEQMNRQLETAAKMAEEANRVKSRFLANMSHEIRTPLNGVIGMLHLLADSGLRPDQKDLTGTALASAENLLSLLNDVLDLSKMEEGKAELHTTVFSLPNLVQEVAASYSALALNKKLGWQCQIPSDCTLWVRGDDVRLRQILGNLISNAIKFTHEGWVEMVLHHTMEPEQRVRLTFSIRDTGIGIPEQMRAALFQRFSQADNSLTRRYGGSGLGLAISQELALLLGGKITVAHPESGGTQFSLTLSMELADAPPTTPAIPTTEPSVPSAALHLSSSSSRRVLLVEDNHTNQVVAKGLLKKLGLDVLIAENGRIGLEMAQGERFCLVLMDIQMPEMDGLEATRHIREWEKGKGGEQMLPIIALTAHTLESDHRACIEAGMNDFLSKPVTVQDLRRICQRFIPGFY